LFHSDAVYSAASSDTILLTVQLAFLWATYGSTAGAVILFLGIVLFARWKRLLFIPDATSYSSNNQK